MHKVIPEKLNPIRENREVKIYPTFQIDSEDLPELANWKYKDKKLMVVEVEVMSLRQGKEWQGQSEKEKDDKVHATVKILKVGLKSENFQQEYARKRANANV